ncbi:hypothetical protein HNP47_000867 [Brevundimonas vesicularis]|uniref:Uncharacterized protein n=1 Tax=Brevundimonas vesicularis TaxID=41276 RepID=A0A7W9FST8_BREVE|nr:hypothetical protein [Brevundimonas vesicularis]MBB5770898.1 hypothetical protein [Brevundimonas vesicularis]
MANASLIKSDDMALNLPAGSVVVLAPHSAGEDGALSYIVSRHRTSSYFDLAQSTEDVRAELFRAGRSAETFVQLSSSGQPVLVEPGSLEGFEGRKGDDDSRWIVVDVRAPNDNLFQVTVDHTPDHLILLQTTLTEKEAGHGQDPTHA